MPQFTVIFVMPIKGMVEPLEFFQCVADDYEQAEMYCLDSHTGCRVLWVSDGFGPEAQEPDTAVMEFYRSIKKEGHL